MAELPRKQLKASSILDFFGRKSLDVASQANSVLNADTNSLGNKPDNSGTFDDNTTILLPDIIKEESNFDSHSEFSPEPDPDGSSSPAPEHEREGPEGESRSMASATQSLGESSQLPVTGPYNFGALKSSILRGRLSDDDKYKVLKHLDQPLQYKFPPIMEGKQLRKFQTSWFLKYPWLT